MIPDFIPGTGSPFTADGYRDWIPGDVEEEEIKKPEKSIIEPNINAMSDEDIRDLGFDPKEVRLRALERVANEIIKETNS